MPEEAEAIAWNSFVTLALIKKICIIMTSGHLESSFFFCNQGLGYFMLYYLVVCFEKLI
jgi:hypothetical protein